MQETRKLPRVAFSARSATRSHERARLGREERASRSAGTAGERRRVEQRHDGHVRGRSAVGRRRHREGTRIPAPSRARSTRRCGRMEASQGQTPGSGAVRRQHRRAARPPARRRRPVSAPSSASLTFLPPPPSTGGRNRARSDRRRRTRALRRPGSSPARHAARDRRRPVDRGEKHASVGKCLLELCSNRFLYSTSPLFLRLPFFNYYLSCR